MVPAFNEESRIGGSIERLRDYLQTFEKPWEIVVVDDGSSDRTAEIVDEQSKADGRVRLVKAPHAGKGAAVKRGMLEAKGEWRFLSDADLSMPPGNLQRFFSADGGKPAYDISIGSREAAGARRIGEPWSRHFLGRVFNWTVKLVALRGIEDTQCGFKLYSAEAANAVFPIQRLQGFAFDVENLFIARKAGFSIGEVPVDWQYYEGGKVTLASSVAAYLDIFRVRLNQLMGRYRIARKR
ncbi:MAG: glycosyltransferase family 2 protein [Chloroflexi bacterium]|nr:glycosyltransferase family 2 protein [Chloroflexota bacterium]MDA1297677.1 glycosyltransferase family 2 protein [Chloroflexota bacterium]